MPRAVHLAALCSALAACASDRAATAATSYAATGIASWYGEELAGNRTASGERFDPAGFTAAHRTLPLGSLVEVTDLATGRAILVRINDRGPGRGDRLIDLSSGAARRLGTDRRPLAAVRVRTVALGSEGRLTAAGTPVGALASAALPASRSGRYLVQVASFADRDRARALADRLDADCVAAGTLWRVRLGPYDAAGAQRARDAVAARGYADAHLLATD